LAQISLARLDIGRSDYASAKALCHTALEFVPADIERFAVPVWVVAACADLDIEAAIVALESAAVSCGKHIYAELLVDVGELIERTAAVRPRTAEHFLLRSAETTDVSLHFRIAYLRGVTYERLGDHESASTAFATSRTLLDQMLAAFPHEHRPLLEQHPWAEATRRFRVV
jgi:hypothetical protein